MSRTYSVLVSAPLRGVQGSRTFCALIVIPRSRSMSMRTRYWARMLRPSTMPVTSSIRSASVDLPWSMWAMMQKFRMRAGSVLAGVVTVLPSSHGTRPDRATAGDGRVARVAGRRVGLSARALVSWETGPPARRPLLLCARTHCQTFLSRRRGSRVANIKSQIKRIRTNEKARQRNVAVRSALKTAVRRVRTAAEAGDAAAAATAFEVAAKQLDKAASKGVIHKNQAANRKSGLAKQVAGL